MPCSLRKNVGDLASGAITHPTRIFWKDSQKGSNFLERSTKGFAFSRKIHKGFEFSVTEQNIFTNPGNKLFILVAQRNFKIKTRYTAVCSKVAAVP